MNEIYPSRIFRSVQLRDFVDDCQACLRAGVLASRGHRRTNVLRACAHLDTCSLFLADKTREKTTAAFSQCRSGYRFDGDFVLQCPPVHSGVHRHRLVVPVHLDGGLSRGDHDETDARQTYAALARAATVWHIACRSGIFETDGIAQFHIAGVVLGLLSAVSYTMFLLFSGKAAIGVNPWVRSASMSTGSFLLAGLVYTPVFLWNGALLDGLFPYVFLLAFFGIFIPTVFFNFGVPHTGPGMAAILGAAELPMAVFSSFIILGETVSALQVTGVVVILLGMILPEWLRQRHKRLKSSLS